MSYADGQGFEKLNAFVNIDFCNSLALAISKEDAIREGPRAVELLPVERDSINGSHLLMHLAMIYAATGEKDLAFEKLRALLSRPGDGNYGDFRLNPFWDPLRGDPRFEKLVASLAPKD